MELLDLWCGCLSVRKLAQYVRWLPKDAALYQSMRMDRPAPEATAPAALVMDDPLAAMQHGYIESLLLLLLNRVEARDYAETPEKDRPPTFRPTLPPGYKLASDIGNSDAALAEYFARMQPPTD